MRRLVALSVVLVLVFAACGDKKEAASPVTTSAAPLSVIDTPPPWPPGDRQSERIVKAGLPPLTAEGDKVHYHAHIDVFHNGEPVDVPAGIGVDFKAKRISPLHTHYPTGVIHVEAEEDEIFTLGQFLTEWGLRQSADCIADICAPAPMEVYVNGEKQDVPVSELQIRPDIQIALILGTPPAEIPAGYTCVDQQDACPDIPT